jgi:SAM-dependent methyltransferase
MANWTAGYVADIDYTYGFYRELTPALLAYAGLLQGKRTPDPNGSLAYCELGSGQGLTTNLLAAANPQIDFYATDFIPGHIAESRRLAAEAGSTNVHFFDQSFQDFIDEPSLPEFDIVSLHGIYSWVTPDNRAAIVEFLRRKLKPGGLAYVSYNTMGWAPATPMRELMYRYGAVQGGSSPRRLASALELMDKVFAVGPRYVAANPALAQRLEALKKIDKNYLVHEYFNEAWSLLYHGDVAQEFSEAKLSYLGSAHLLDHIDAVNLTEPQQQLLRTIDDGGVREMLRDFITGQQFRRDIFVKGSASLSPREFQTGWLEQRFALSTPKDDVPKKVTTLQGESNLKPEVYDPLVEILASGPRTFREIVSQPGIAAMGGEKVQQAITVLVGAGHIQPCLGAKGEGARKARTKAFNTALFERAQADGVIGFVASPVTGGGVALSRLQQLFLLARQRKIADAPQFVWNLLAGQGQRLMRDGAPIESAEDNLAEIRKEHDEFVAKRLPVVEQLGIA